MTLFSAWFYMIGFLVLIVGAISPAFLFSRSSTRSSSGTSTIFLIPVLLFVGMILLMAGIFYRRSQMGRWVPIAEQFIREVNQAISGASTNNAPVATWVLRPYGMIRSAYSMYQLGVRLP